MCGRQDAGAGAGSAVRFCYLAFQNWLHKGTLRVLQPVRWSVTVDKCGAGAEFATRMANKHAVFLPRVYHELEHQVPPPDVGL